MSKWRSLVCLVAFAVAQSAAAQGQIESLPQFAEGQVASAGAVNANFRALQVRAVKLQRPAFLRKPNVPQTIVIPATATRPARVAIDDLVLTLTQDIEINLTASGRGGIDTGVVQPSRLYYVYVVFGALGNTSLSATVSLNPPAQGPVGFGTQWSYLGSFITDTGSVAPRFSFSRGRCTRFGGPVVQTLSTTAVSLALLVPEHATEVHGRFRLSGAPLISPSVLTAGPNPSNLQQIIVAPLSVVGLNTSLAFASVPLFDGPSIALQVSDAVLTGAFETFGWTEDPTLFQ